MRPRTHMLESELCFSHENAFPVNSAYMFPQPRLKALLQWSIQWNWPAAQTTHLHANFRSQGSRTVFTNTNRDCL